MLKEAFEEGMGICCRCQNENTSDCPYPNKADSFAGCGKFLNNLPMDGKPRSQNSLMTGSLLKEPEEPVLKMTTDKVKIHQEICHELSGIYAYKNKNYGSSFTSTREKYPNAILVRLHDKFSRLETLLLNEENPKDESIEDTLTDLANYCIMELVERRIEKEEE